MGGRADRDWQDRLGTTLGRVYKIYPKACKTRAKQKSLQLQEKKKKIKYARESKNFSRILVNGKTTIDRGWGVGPRLVAPCGGLGPSGLGPALPRRRGDAS